MSETHFGFKAVEAGAKAGLVQDVFSSVAARYDLMNDLMSLGIHRLWKAALVDWLRPRRHWQVLDVAGGTGDVAFRLLDAMGEGSGRVTVCDLTEAMVRQGRARAPKQHAERLGWLVGDAEALPLKDASLDAYTIAFGLRNVTRPEVALAEARRVLKPGGRFMCLEFSQLVLPHLDRLYEAYSFNLLPEIGAWVANDRESYAYLVESIRRFPPQEALADLMREAGLSRVSYRNLSGGIAALHSGWRI